MSTDNTWSESLTVSAYCLLRYFERHYSVDIEKIKKEILPDHIREKLKPGIDRYVIGDLEFRIADNVIATCIPTKADEPLKQAKNKPKKHRSNDKRRKDKTWQAEQKYHKKSKKGRYV